MRGAGKVVGGEGPEKKGELELFFFFVFLRRFFPGQGCFFPWASRPWLRALLSLQSYMRVSEDQGTPYKKIPQKRKDSPYTKGPMRYPDFRKPPKYEWSALFTKKALVPRVMRELALAVLLISSPQLPLFLPLFLLITLLSADHCRRATSHDTFQNVLHLSVPGRHGGVHCHLLAALHVRTCRMETVFERR